MAFTAREWLPNGPASLKELSLTTGNYSKLQMLILIGPSYGRPGNTLQPMQLLAV